LGGGRRPRWAPPQRPPQQPQPAGAQGDRVITPADRDATRLRWFNAKLAHRTQHNSEAAIRSIAAMAADREAHVYNTRASDAAYLDMDVATLLRLAATFPVCR